VEHGFQVALMAPTEILAEQHARSLSEWLQALGVEVLLLSGRDKGRRRQLKEGRIETGQASIVVGTHALFQASVQFQRLGLVIIVEQHRFGVAQRQALRDKAPPGLVPHQLVMTATPIPRTLAMSIHADLDYSQIDELPPGRSPVITSILAASQRPALIQRVRAACGEGKQLYWVCTLIEESEALQCEAAENTFEQLQRELPELRIGLVHGRMKAAEKEAVVQAFKRRELQLLVATTVIEVGVDVPNASIMIIENPERLGLSQIHQLRGRVGRGSEQSYCLLLLGQQPSQAVRERLEIIRQQQDGFVIAEKDLELRGAGEVLGTRQTGEAGFRIADLLRDRELFPLAEELADIMMQPGHETLRKRLIANWIGDRAGFSDIA
jgi:ATP-dependent DNA helicase RecG